MLHVDEINGVVIVEIELREALRRRAVIAMRKGAKVGQIEIAIAVAIAYHAPVPAKRCGTSGRTCVGTIPAGAGKLETTHGNAAIG
jgi:hypothetical protein